MVAQIQNKGLANITAAWVAYTTKPAKYVQWGTGDGQVKGDNSLDAANGIRYAGTQSQVTTTETNDTYQVTRTLTLASGTLGVKEVGVFDGAGSGDPASGDDMIIYGDFSVINLAANDSIAFTIKVQFS